MGGCLKPAPDRETMAELKELGHMDTDREQLEKKREEEDRQLERDYPSNELLRMLAEKNKLKHQRSKADKESVKRKERRAIVIAKVEKKESARLEAEKKESARLEAEITEKDRLEKEQVEIQREGLDKPNNPASAGKMSYIMVPNLNDDDSSEMSRPVLADSGSSYQL